MRASVSACCAVAALLCLLLALCAGGAAGAGYQGRSKPRSIRGFKNIALSTARGFGKRTGASGAAAAQAANGGAAGGPGAASVGNGPDAASARAAALEMLAGVPPGALEGFPEHDSFPVEWFVEEMQSNPDLARVIVHKFVDANQDGELSPEELLRPLY